MKKAQAPARYFCSIIGSICCLALATGLAADTVKNVVCVGGGEGAASDAELRAAYKKLAATGGEIVLRAPVRITGRFDAPEHDAPITLSGRETGADASARGGEKLILGGSYHINGPTTFANLSIVSEGKGSVYIYCNGHEVVFDKGIVCEPPRNGRFPSMAGANHAIESGKPGSNVTINSGQWHAVVAGTFNDARPSTGALKLVINGGQFYGPVCAAGTGRHTGDAELTLNGGVFQGGVAGIGDSADAAFRGNLRIIVNGGRFYNKIDAAKNAKTELAGLYSLAINGGEFGSLTDITGTRDVRGGSKSSIEAGRAALLDEPVRGTVTFANPIIKGADPWVFMHNGYYYCTMTGGTRLSAYKAANLPDLHYAPPVTIWQPPRGREYSRNLWSPKIYHLNADDVGEKLAGWYLYVSANDGKDNASADQRMYVLRSLTGDPLGPYGSPVSGRLNVPVKMTGAKGKTFNREWTVGPKVLQYGGKLYFIWVGRIGDRHSANKGDHWQCLYIDELINPWTVSGKPVMICRPTLSWEKHGAGRARDGRMLPEVIEGGTPVYSDDGTLYLLYAASGYWTKHYAIGLMKLVGNDPLNPASWNKAVQPIFKASDTVSGPGNACYVSSPEGRSRWTVYHAYVGPKTTGVPRQLFAEPYFVNDKTMIIGAGQPLPLGSPLRMEANPMPLRKKISGFTEPLPAPDAAFAASAETPAVTPAPTWRQPNVGSRKRGSTE